MTFRDKLLARRAIRDAAIAAADKIRKDALEADYWDESRRAHQLVSEAFEAARRVGV